MPRLSRALLASAVLAATVTTLAASSGPAAATTYAGPAVSIDLTTGRHAISSGIYGMNDASPAVASAIALPADRWGGNATERYDWQSGVTSTASDWYFENTPDCFSAAQSWCGNADHASYRAWQERLDADHTTHAATVLTLPATGWVSKPPASYGHPLLCAYPRADVASASFDTYDDCGNGKDANGAWIGGAVPDRTSVQVNDESFIGGWVDALKARYGDDAHGGVKWYEPGNEPALWSDTHHDLYGAHHVTAQEQWDRQSSVAAVAKAHDPTAHVLGPSEWGWTGYFCSDADSAGGDCSATSPDRALHGGLDQSAWWLEQAKAWEQAHGSRLVDAFDLHYYPQDETGSPSETRSLWDPTYTDPSWIGGTVRLIPRMHDWVDQHYPGTKIAIGEYDFWHHDQPVGGVMEADALGIFAREQVDLALLWQPVTPTDPTYWAFRMYRNADGHGKSFGSSYAPTHSADQSLVSAYSATRADGSLTVMLVNKTTSPRRVPLTIKGFRNSTVHPFSYGGSGGIVADAAALELNGSFTTVVPAMGFQLLDLPGRVESPLLSSALAAPASAGHSTTQTITETVKSVDGPSAVNPVMQLVLPAGSRISSVTAPTGWTCTRTTSGTSPVLRCTARSLAARTSRSVSVRVAMPRAAGTATSKLTVTASRLARPVPAITRSTRIT